MYIGVCRNNQLIKQVNKTKKADKQLDSHRTVRKLIILNSALMKLKAKVSVRGKWLFDPFVIYPVLQVLFYGISITRTFFSFLSQCYRHFNADVIAQQTLSSCYTLSVSFS